MVECVGASLDLERMALYCMGLEEPVDEFDSCLDALSCGWTSLMSSL